MEGNEGAEIRDLMLKLQQELAGFMGTNPLCCFVEIILHWKCFLSSLFGLDAKLSICTQKIASFYLERASYKLRCCI